jgi:malonyl CoA-acyl carrier protein transacylase
MIFTGQGSQWSGMGQTLMHFPAYAEVGGRVACVEIADTEARGARALMAMITVAQLLLVVATIARTKQGLMLVG